MRRRPYGIVLVGTCALLREGLSRILGAGEFRIVASVARVEEAELTSVPPQQPLLLIIHSGNDPAAAIGQIERFKQQCAWGRVAVLAEHYALDHMALAFRAGANAYFVKVTNCDAFVKALELVMMGETIVPPAVLSCLSHETEDLGGKGAAPQAANGNDDARPTTENKAVLSLSARERCILRHLINGESNKTIARKIDISEATVKVHIKAILRKIRVQNRTQAAIWAINNGQRAWPPEPEWLAEESVPSRTPRGLPVIRAPEMQGPALSSVLVRPLEATRHSVGVDRLKQKETRHDKD